MLSKFIVFFIELYQKTLSPDHGPLKVRYPTGFCKFYPSCSEYTKQAIMHKGVVIGVSKGFWRLLRCNPWAKPGVDDVN